MEPIYHLPAAASRIKWPLYISYKLDKVYYSLVLYTLKKTIYLKKVTLLIGVY